MANAKIFCNTPWYEINIYHDGSLGVCCQESRKIYNNNASQYNIQNMSLTDWFNSVPVREFRKAILSDTPTDICSSCHHEETVNGTSRRHRANQKSVIFTKDAFQDSYNQSPGYPHFNLSEVDGFTDTLPIDLHIDLGNYCNLACKMCHSSASTRIATQYVKWGHVDHKQYLGNDWTKDTKTWNRFLNELLTIPKLKNIHFMGGETLLTSRFEDLVDFLTAHSRFDVCFSFVTNGTTFNESLINKLKKFTRVGIEVSIETATQHNDYVRQGTDTNLVLTNIKRYQQLCDSSSISVTIRPAISLLTIGNYYTLLEYCLENKLIIKSLLVTTPSYLDCKILPVAVKEQYLSRYNKLAKLLADVDINSTYNESDVNNYKKSVKAQCEQVQNMLRQPSHTDQDVLLADMVKMCRQWDNEFGFNAVDLYPELAEVFVQYGY